MNKKLKRKKELSKAEVVIIKRLEDINDKIAHMEDKNDAEKKTKLKWKRAMSIVKIATLLLVIYTALEINDIELSTQGISQLLLILTS